MSAPPQPLPFNKSSTTTTTLLLTILLLFSLLTLIHGQSAADKDKEGNVKLFPIPPPQSSKIPRKQLISGGENVASNEFPHLVSLQYHPSASDPYQHFCGASIISARWLVTAAHCMEVDNMDSTKIRVVAGTINRNDDCSSGSCVIRQVSQQIVNPNFNKQYIRNDIALIQLSSDLPLGQANIQAIPIEGGSIPFHTVLTLAGWGLTSTGATSLPVTAQKAYLPLQTQDVCNGQNLGMQTPWQLCAGEGQGINSCQGDSGGPLFWKKQNSGGDVQYGLAGLVSYGPQGCGGQGSYGVYTNATYWINYVRNYVSDLQISNYNGGGSSQPSQPSNPGGNSQCNCPTTTNAVNSDL